MKSTKTFTIDHDIYTSARATGANLSQICEQALANHINHAAEIGGIYKVFATKDDKTNEFLNRMVWSVERRGFPGNTKHWSNRMKEHFLFEISGYELYKFIKELIDDG